MVTSMRISRPATEGESGNKEEWLVNVVHPPPGAFFHQSTWMADGAIVVVNPFSSSLPPDTVGLLRLLATGGVRPILFIDRLDLALGSETSSQDIYGRFAMTVATVNSVLKACREELDVAIPDVSVEAGSVIFGALHLGWAFTVDQCIARCTPADRVDPPSANGFWVSEPTSSYNYQPVSAKHACSGTSTLTMSQRLGPTRRGRLTAAESWREASPSSYWTPYDDCTGPETSQARSVSQRQRKS